MARTNSEVISERAFAMGQRMKAAAIDAGYTTATAMAEAMGMRQSAISRYWRGQREPSGDRMALYARLTGKPVLWFYRDADERAAEATMAATMRTFGRVAGGDALADALADEGGRLEKQGASADPDSALAGLLRLRLNRAAGGDFLALPPREQRRLADRLVAQAFQYRSR